GAGQGVRAPIVARSLPRIVAMELRRGRHPLIHVRHFGPVDAPARAVAAPRVRLTREHAADRSSRDDGGYRGMRDGRSPQAGFFEASLSARPDPKPHAVT